MCNFQCYLLDTTVQCTCILVTNIYCDHENAVLIQIAKTACVQEYGFWSPNIYFEQERDSGLPNFAVNKETTNRIST